MPFSYELIWSSEQNLEFDPIGNAAPLDERIAKQAARQLCTQYFPPPSEIPIRSSYRNSVLVERTVCIASRNILFEILIAFEVMEVYFLKQRLFAL